MLSLAPLGSRSEFFFFFVCALGRSYELKRTQAFAGDQEVRYISNALRTGGQ